MLLILFTAPAFAQEIPDSLNVIFGPGERIESANFTGPVWVERMLTIADETQPVPIGNVVFAPRSRSNWHRHPAGQTLLVLDGVGFYQEEGGVVRVLRKGDRVQCPPGVPHWHGAANDQWFVQLALTKEHPEGRVLWGAPVTDEQYSAGISRENKPAAAVTPLARRYQHIATIAALNTKGNLTELGPALGRALDAGMTVNECKEILVHLYAYTGFPRSIQGLRTLMETVKARQAQGIEDVMGADAGAIQSEGAKYDRGKAILESLTGRPSTGRADYGDFAPIIDAFLKEHLFADLFERDVLSYADREITTISALISLGGVEPMLRGHLGIALNIGVTGTQLHGVWDTLEATLGKQEISDSRTLLSNILSNKN